MQARYLDPGRLTSADIQAWGDLSQLAVQPNAFAHPTFVLAACRYLQDGRDTSLLVVEDAGRWEACLPLQARRSWRGIPRRSLQAWRHIYSFSSAPLLRQGVAEAAADAIMACLAEGRGPDRRAVGVLALDELPDGGASEALRGAAARRGLPVLELRRASRACVQRRPDADSYLSGLSSRRRSELRRRRRRLSEIMGSEVSLVDRSSEPEAVESFLVLESSGWKGKAGTALACQPDHARFFRAMCEGFRSTGLLHLWSLETRLGPPLAMACRLQSGSGLFTFKVAYDEKFASLGPGVTAEVEALVRFHGLGDVELLDSCTDPGNELLNELYPDRLAVTDVAICLGGAFDRLLLAAFPTARALRRRLGNGSRPSGPAQR